MSSWVWVIVLLLVITAIIIALMWYSGLLAAPDADRRVNRAPPSQADVAEADAPEAAPSGRAVPARRTPPPPSPTAIPPPALAGPRRGEADMPPVEPARRAAKPPAAATNTVSTSAPKAADSLPRAACRSAARSPGRRDRHERCEQKRVRTEARRQAAAGPGRVEHIDRERQAEGGRRLNLAPTPLSSAHAPPT